MGNFPHPRRPIRGYTPEALANAKHRYEETDELQDSIATDLRISRRTLDKLAKREGWKLRKDRPPRELPQALRLEMVATEALAEAATDPPLPESMTDDPEGTPAAPSLAFRLEAAVEKELRKVEALRGAFGTPANRSIEAERIARTLATLTETLFKVRRLREAGASPLSAPDDEVPADADEFRRQLAHRIEALVRGRDDGGVPAAGGDADAGPAAA
ncbi:conserved hypothetical protein [Rhodopseudomonas palustris BisB5]|uniref:Uncharacterized protein n=1 Tax=Rhodopseudomonas palustris (strain BisB5) TaxID=316057 RepID=Q139M9_RHOPS|nr:conserved hypothetical protein [Rhodopseudomonas palustris BisB5]